MAKCKNCGNTLRSDLGFCNECGVKTKVKTKSGTTFTLSFWVNILIALGAAAGIFYLIWRLK